MSNRYIYAESYGCLYRFYKRNWAQMLLAITNGKEVNFSHYGKRISNEVFKITDIDPTKALYFLTLGREK